MSVAERIAELANQHSQCDDACDVKLLLTLVLRSFHDGVMHGLNLTLQEIHDDRFAGTDYTSRPPS